MSLTKWCVCTGPPCSGISTTLDILFNWAHPIYPEVARFVLDEWKSMGLDPLVERRKDEEAFQRAVLRMKLEREERLDRNRICFLDRGVPDSIPYLEVCGVDPAGVIDILPRDLYWKIFYFEPLPWIQDYARTEDEITRARLAAGLKKIYTDLGYELILIPANKSARDRAGLILGYCGLKPA